jgi:hypothetical protein
MAVNGELLVYPGQELTPQDFAMMMERISVIKSGILSGCEVTFEENESGEKTSILNVGKGYVFVRGRLVSIRNGTLDTSSLSSTAESWFVYARLHIDDAQSSIEDLCTVFVTDTAPTDATESFNEENTGIAYATLATIKVSDKSIKQSTTPYIVSTESVTLFANNWTDSRTDIPKYTLADPRFSSGTYIELVPKTIGQDYEYIKSLQTANLQIYSVSDGELVLGCYGWKPTIDLEIGIIFRGVV